jgi:dihydropteroate synthase
MHFQPMIMGVLNVTPDSFSDGGHYLHPESALTHALKMHTEGADVIDIGGESSRPGATPVSVQEELDRVMPVIEKIKQAAPVLISVDTVKPEVMKEAIKLGVWMINDIHALQSPGALSVLAQASCQICLMHKQGQPLTMQDNPHYSGDVVKDVSVFFEQRIAATTKAGIDINRLWLDPGIGFGKKVTHNLSLLKKIQSFSSLGLPLMVGVSRKSSLGHVVNQPVEARQSAGLAAAVYLLLQGVKMIRTHDIRDTKEAVLLLEAILNASEPRTT